MTVDLEDYRACFAKAPEDFDTVEASFHEAAKVMSAQGLSDLMEGAKGLCNLGRGHDLVLAYIENMPAVAKECGEDVIRDCVAAAMKLSSMTSGDVIALMFASLPTAARRLGDPELLRGYLQLIHQLSAKAARGLRPMLGVSDELLSKLTLSGLKRWANFGADAYRRDLPNLTRYFALESADAKKMLQQERRGTLFIDTQRKLNFYLRALWGRDFFLRPAAADYEGFRPYAEQHVLHLPDAVDDRSAVFVEPLAAALRVLDQVAIATDTRAAVIGPGRLGLMVGQVLKAAGADVVMIGRAEASLALPRKLGLSSCIEPATTGFDVVVETSGQAAGLDRADDWVRPRGAVVLKSTYASPPNVDLARVVINEVALMGSRCGPFDKALHWLRAGRVQVEAMIDGVFDLDEFEAAFALARQPGVRKVLLVPKRG